MKEENYRCAVECYTKAIDLDLRNAVYYCNRYFSLFALSTLLGVLKSRLETNRIKWLGMPFSQDIKSQP